MAGGFDLHALGQVFGNIQAHARVVGNQVVNYGLQGSPEEEYDKIVDFTNGVLESSCLHGFVETAALKEAEGILNTVSFFIIVGWPGTGKTALGQELLKRNRQNFQPLQLRAPQDWDIIVHKNRTKTHDEKCPLIFIDNGLHEDATALRARLPIWQKLFVDIQPEVANRRAKVILVCRRQDYNTAMQHLGGIEFLKRAQMVDLDASALVPSDKEKVSIYRNMIASRNFKPDLSPKHIKEMASQPNAVGFPECCSIYCKSNQTVPKESYLFSSRLQEQAMGTEMQLPNVIGALVHESINSLTSLATEGYRTILEVFQPPHVDATLTQWNFNLDVEDNTVLHFIALKHNNAAIKRALANKTDVGMFINAKNKNGETVLHIAVRNGMAESVQLLLENGADPSLTDAEGNTASHVAAAQNDDVFNILAKQTGALQHGVKNNAGMTPLHVAAMHENVEAVRQLVEAGADVAARDQEGCTCLHHVARQGVAEVLEALGPLSPDVLNIQNNMGRTALADSTILSSEVTEKLLQLGADDTIVDNEEEVPIMTAIEAGNEEAALLLLNHNPTFDILKNKAGDFPLHLALKARMVKLAKAMMQNGTDVACRGSRGQTPLMLASASGDLQLVKWMLEETDSVLTIAEKDEDGETAADIATRLQHEDVLLLLAEKGTEIGLL